MYKDHNSLRATDIVEPALMEQVDMQGTAS